MASEPIATTRTALTDWRSLVYEQEDPSEEEIEYPFSNDREFKRGQKENRGVYDGE